MARIRTIKPSFFTSLTVADLPFRARLTFIGLWTYVDDSGVGLDETRLVKAEIWPLDSDVGGKSIESDLRLLADKQLIARFEADGRRYLYIVGWQEHQRISHPTASKFPQPPLANGSGTNREPIVSPPEPLSPEGKGREGKGTPLPPASGGSRTSRRSVTPDPPRGDLARMAANAQRVDDEPPAADPSAAISQARATLRAVHPARPDFEAS